MVDAYLRQFAGSTQVNVSDLNYLRYPSETQLLEIGRKAGPNSSQSDIDAVMHKMFS